MAAGMLARQEVGPATALFVIGQESISEEWLAAVQPRVIVASVGAGEVPGLAGRAVLKTAERGSITLSTDGQNLWVESER